MANRSPAGPRFGCMDFLSQTETLHAPMPMNEARDADISRSCDVFFAIRAPTVFTQTPPEAAVVLFLEQPNQETRELPANGYRVTCPEPLSTQQFLGWASRTTQMIRDGIMHPGLNGLDVADLRDMLQACNSKHLVAHIIDYEDVNKPPLGKLQALNFRNVFAWLFADSTMTLAHFSELGCALEEINPQADCIRLGAGFHAESDARLLLLGEPLATFGPVA